MRGSVLFSVTIDHDDERFTNHVCPICVHHADASGVNCFRGATDLFFNFEWLVVIVMGFLMTNTNNGDGPQKAQAKVTLTSLL